MFLHMGEILYLAALLSVLIVSILLHTQPILDTMSKLLTYTVASLILACLLTISLYGLIWVIILL